MFVLWSTWFTENQHVIIKKWEPVSEACRSSDFLLLMLLLKLQKTRDFSIKRCEAFVIETKWSIFRFVRAGDENPKYRITSMEWFSLKFETIGKSEEWLLAELEKEGYDNVLISSLRSMSKGKINVVTY